MFISSNFNGGRMGARGGIGCLLLGVVGLVIAFYVLKGFFTLLWWAAPLLFIATLIINWRVVADAGKTLLKLFRTRPLTGLVVAVLSVVAFPVLALFLFLSALGGRRLERYRAQFGQPAASEKPIAEKSTEGEFIDFEEIASEPLDMELPPEPPRPVEKDPRKPGNPYDDLFKS